jgi:hypothetical protein
MEMVLSINEFYKKKGKGPNDKSSQSPTVTPKTTTSQRNSPVAHPSRKLTKSSLGGGGEKNPTPRKVERSHKLPLRKKRKNVMQ